MKLSKLLELKDKLLSVDLSAHVRQDSYILEELDTIVDGVKELPSTLCDDLAVLMDQKEQMVNAINHMLREYLDQKINSWHIPYHAKSEEFHSIHDRMDVHQWEEYKTMLYGDSPELDIYSAARIGRYAYWQNAGMLYQMDKVTGLSSLFSFYPTYVVDKWVENIEKIRNHIPESQYRKVRFYDHDYLEYFPSCMSFIVSRNHFTHTCFKVFKKEIDWLVDQMLPGGTIAFNFNDCEYYKCAELFEQGYRSYMTGSEVASYLQSKDLTIVESKYLDETRTVWIEATLAGSTTPSLKCGETMGKIINKNYI